MNRKKLLATVTALAVSAASLAAAPVIVVDDSKVDYSHTNAQCKPEEAPECTGYVGLRRAGDDLVLELSQAKLDSGLPPIWLTVWHRGTDARGKTRPADIDDITAVELTSYGTDYSQFTVFHPGAFMGETVSAWVSALEGLGFSVHAREPGTATTVVDLSGPLGELRVVFHAQGGGVRVHVGQGA